MHNTSDKYLLQIQPKLPPSRAPVIDELTKKMEKLIKTAGKGTQWRGWHNCCCGEMSGSCDLLVDKYITNSLAVHYLTWHRSEMPETELSKLKDISQ